MFKVLVAVLLILIKVTVLAKLDLADKTKLLEVYKDCVHKLNIDEKIALNIFQGDSTLPEDSQQINDLVECEINKMHVVNRKGTLVAVKFKKLFYTFLGNDPDIHITNKTTKLIKKGFNHCGVRRGIPLNGQIAIKLYNCLIKYLRWKKVKNIMKRRVNENPKNRHYKTICKRKQR